MLNGSANFAFDIRPLPDGTVQVQVREKADAPQPCMIYLLGADLRVKMVEASWTMWNWDHSLTDRDLDELGRAVQVRRSPARFALDWP
jgi:hypothetical protein